MCTLEVLPQQVRRGFWKPQRISEGPPRAAGSKLYGRLIQCNLPVHPGAQETHTMKTLLFVTLLLVGAMICLAACSGPQNTAGSIMGSLRRKSQNSASREGTDATEGGESKNNRPTLFRRQPFALCERPRQSTGSPLDMGNPSRILD
jgi:hypothetical protein